MSIMYIQEYERMGEVPGGYRVSAGVEPAHASQAITFAASVASANFNVRTKFVRIHVDGPACLKFGASPTATNQVDMPMTTGQTEYFAVDAAAVAAGLKVAAITKT